MRFYQHSHPYYCGVDLHARTMHVYVADGVGITIVGGKFVRIEIRKGIVGFGVAFLKEER
ncbi:MAG: hypothetical protein JWN70_4390, partial [Planctomycetaceae bacterium]|nr:hypothetical protein [Planctomycetaceae bacterium]